MNWQQMIELCLEANPLRGDAYIRPLLNVTLDEFAQETKMLKTTATEVTTTNTSAALPTDCVEVNRVTLPIDGVTIEARRAGTHKMHLFEGYYVYWIVGGNIYLGKIYQANLIAYAATWTIEYTKRFTHLASGTDLSTESDVPLQFRRGVCARVREDLFADERKQAREHAIWMDTVKKGIKYTQLNHDASSFQALVHEL